MGREAARGPAAPVAVLVGTDPAWDLGCPGHHWIRATLPLPWDVGRKQRGWSQEMVVVSHGFLPVWLVGIQLDSFVFCFPYHPLAFTFLRENSHTVRFSLVEWTVQWKLVPGVVLLSPASNSGVSHPPQRKLCHQQSLPGPGEHEAAVCMDPLLPDPRERPSHLAPLTSACFHIRPFYR